MEPEIKNTRHDLPDEHYLILRHLVMNGHEAYIVGGAVRDLELGLTPKDYDITTSATPEQVEDLFRNTNLVGASFGVTLVKLKNAETAVEVATFRMDGAYSDGRRPDDVKYTTDVREDLKRRDFTINALLMDRYGVIHDYVGGLTDLQNKTIRTVGDADDRFNEDPVRMLRAVRFASKLLFRIDPVTGQAIDDNSALLRRVARERIATELLGILTSGNAVTGLVYLDGLDLLAEVIPELCHLKDTPQNPKYHPEGDVWTHTLGLLKQLPKDCSQTLALAALLHDIGKPATLAFSADGQPTFHGHEEAGATMTETILRRLMFSNDVIKVVSNHVARHMTFRNLPKMRKAKRLRFVRQEHFDELLELHRMDALAGSGNLENYGFAKKLAEETPPEVLRPERLITGADLIALGAKPGPIFSELLQEIETQQLEGKLETKQSALDFAWGYLSAGGDV